MTKRLFSTAKNRRPYRPRGYRSVFATDVDPETEEETSSEVSEEEVGLSADEFTGDLTDDPLADLADESIWAVTPGTDEDYSVTEDDFEREEAITNTSSRRVAGTEDRPGNIYRGIASDFLTDDEYSQIVDWARQNEFDPDNFQMAEPNYEMIYPILERLEGEGGLGRHWSIDYDVASDFASQSARHYDKNNDRDEDDPDYRSPFGIVFRGDWDGEGVDYAEQHRGYDGVMRPSNLPEEKEVTLHPGSEVNLLGMDVFEPGGFNYDIPVPDIKGRAHQRTPERKKDPMTAVDRYLRYASWRGMDPQSKSTLRAFARSGRGTSKTAQRDISRWFMAQKVAHDTARDVLSSSRNYRRKMSSSWHLDNKLSAYVSKVRQKFACSCGAKLDVPAYNICKCGKIWNAYKVHSATKGDTMYVVREVPVRENVLVAGRGKTASRRRHADFLHQKVFDAFEDYLMDRGVHPHREAPQGEIDRALDDFAAEYGNQLGQSGIESLQNAYMYREGSRRQAYDVEDDTFDFFEKARGRGYRFPKNMGDDPDSGTFQDELHNYTGGDRDRMRQVTDFARDNWGGLRHSRINRRHASDRAFEDPDTGFSVAVDNRGGSEVGVVLDPNGSEVDTIHPFNGEYFEDDMYELVNGLDDWLQEADTDIYRRDFHSKKRESRNRRRKARRRVASPKEFGETFLQNNGWTSDDTGRTTWDSPSGNVSYFGHDNMVNVWNRDGDLVDEIPVDPYMAPDEIAEMLNELEQSSSKGSPWYVDDEEMGHPGPDADYMHPYFN